MIWMIEGVILGISWLMLMGGGGGGGRGWWGGSYGRDLALVES